MATQLANVIKFRTLIDQLTKQERKNFLNKIVDQNDGSLITTSLFHYFITETNHAANDVSNVNSILCHMIQSRKKKPKQLPSTNIKLNKFPKSIIGYFASFFPQYDYFRLEKTNRSIFIACNTPNMLIKLDLFGIKDYSSINLSKYASVQQLQLNITKFKNFILTPNNGEFIMNDLHLLSLFAKHKTSFEIETFMNQNCINMQNITALKLYAFGTRNTPFSMDKFYKILTKVPNVEYLRLSDLFFMAAETDFNATKLAELYPNLNGLGVIGGNIFIINALMDEFGAKLHFLTHHRSHSSVDFRNINFSNLKEVILTRPTAANIHHLLTTGQNIEKFILYPRTKQELKTVIPEIIKCKSLQYLEIKANNDHCAAILDGIEKGLYETMKWKRQQIKIRVSVQKNAMIDMTQMIFNVSRVIIWLEKVDIIDFMFILDMNESNKELDVVGILHELNNMSSNIQISAHGLLFLIANKNCKINGFRSEISGWLLNAKSF